MGPQRVGHDLAIEQQQISLYFISLLSLNIHMRTRAHTHTHTPTHTLVLFPLPVSRLFPLPFSAKFTKSPLYFLHSLSQPLIFKSPIISMFIQAKWAFLISFSVSSVTPDTADHLFFEFFFLNLHILK